MAILRKVTMHLRRHIPALLLALAIGLLVSAPQFLHSLDERYLGIPIHLNSDETSYQTYLEEALLGRFGQAGKGITAKSVTEPSFHLSPIEEFEGLFFGWTGLNAPHVFVIMDFLAPFLLILALIAFLQSCGFSRREALIGAGLFGLLQLANLNRPINQRESVLLALLALLCCQYARRGNAIYSTIGGVLLGILVGTNVWAWMLAWCMWGTLLLLLIAARAWDDVRNLARTGLIGLISAVPFIWQIFSIRSHPAYTDTVLRSGLIHWRLPESYPWSAMCLVMALGMLLFWIDRGKRTEEISVVALALSAFTILNQQIVHGYTLMFRAHFLFFLTIAAIGVLLYSLRFFRESRSFLLAMTSLAALVILAAVGFENRKVVAQWRIDDSDFADQHLASALPVLDTLPRSIILSDPSTSVFISGSTKHDVVFTGYLQHTLVTNEDLAEAFCLTQLPLKPEDRHFETRNLLVLANAIGSELDPVKRAALHQKDLALAHEACNRLDTNPKDTLKKEEVEYVFWNAAEEPNWDLSRLKIRLEKVNEGGRWSLWKVTPSPNPLPRREGN